MQSMLDAESRKPRDIHIHSPEAFCLSVEEARAIGWLLRALRPMRRAVDR
jgi:hypothetical protein